MGRSSRRWQWWRGGQSLSHSPVGKRTRSTKNERDGLLLSQLRLTLYHLRLMYRSCTNTIPFSASLGGVVCYFKMWSHSGFTTRFAASCVVTPEKGSVSDVQKVHQHDGYFQNVITRCIVMNAYRSHGCRA